MIPTDETARRTIRRKIRDWRERDEIIGDMQRGLYSVSETVRRLQEHAKYGGDERIHAFSCRNGFMPCRCPYKFDRQNLVPPEASAVEDSWRDLE